MNHICSGRRWTVGLVPLAALALASAQPAAAQIVVSLQPPRLILNRSVFLLWNTYAGADFARYEVFASTVSGFTPSAANRVAMITDAQSCYARVRGLIPDMPYYFKAAIVTTGGTAYSAQVTARTEPDGVSEYRVPTIMYHNVQPRALFPAGYDVGGWMSTENLSRDLAYFKSRGIHCVTHQDIVNAALYGIPLPRNPVMLTFDDAYKNFYQYALPILVSYDYAAVQCVVTRKTGGYNDWSIPEWPAMPLMTWAEIKECQRSGMWMGSHTQTHVDLYLDAAKAYEIAGSRDDLIAQLKVHPECFCYPWGMGGHRVQSILNQVAATGYTLATRTYPADVATTASDRYWFPRNFANQNDTTRDLLQKMEVDTDKDQIQNWRELDWGLDDNAADTDGDGLSDFYEAAYNGNGADYNPFDPTNNPAGTDLNARNTDTDADGLTDYQEVSVYLTNPLRWDTDGDGMSDGFEVGTARNPRVRDPQQKYASSPGVFPGVIECEDFDFGGAGAAYLDTTAANEGKAYRPYESVDISAQTGAGNGYAAGWTKPGEWMAYTVNVVSGGTYKIEVRVAGVGAGGRFHIEFSGADKTGAISVPNTGSWTTYEWVNRTAILSAGTQVMRIVLDGAGTSGFVAAMDSVRVTAVSSPPPGSRAYGGTPWPLPGSVEFENFDVDGQGVAYSDTTAANEGGAYRPAEGVDLAAQSQANNGYTVGWTHAGEWLEYTVNIAAAVTYTIEARVAGVGSGGAIRFKVDGTEVTGNLAIPNTGAWDTYQTVRQTGVSLPAGAHVFQVYLASNGTSGYVAALDSFRVTAEGVAGPLRVECEDFDAGAEGLAYHDTTPANEGGQYRSTAVDIAADAGAGKGYVVGWTKAGEWMNYTVSVPSAGNYTLRARVAGVGTGGRFHVTAGGVDRTGLLSVPNTGAWTAYQMVTKTGVSLSAGSNVIRLVMDNTGPTGFVGAFDYFELEAEAGGGAVLTISAAEPVVPSLQSLEQPLPAQPVDVRVSSGAAPYADGWAVADGDPETIWVGAPDAGGWWVALTYAPMLSLAGLSLDLANGSLTNFRSLYSTNADDWYDLALPLTNGPVAVNYLWVIFPDDGSGRVPRVLELRTE